MGKRLIIKGADFSENAIGTGAKPVWYIDQILPDISTALKANVVNGGWAFSNTDNAKLQGRVINSVKFYPATDGVLNFYKGALGSNGTKIGSITISPSQVGTRVIATFTPVTINSGEYFMIGEANTKGSIYYCQNLDDISFYSKAQSSPTLVKSSSLGISVGYQY